MDQREIEIAVGELEERVDRLRVLYEQYFLGFEKLEPTVPRKDVDRRFAILRKENIRNTALRFRFNVVTQKYNTYAMHWTRICRQIEEGTFKRHVRRAKERFGDAKPAARDRPDSSLDVEIDFEDLESTDLDAVLAEADRAAAKFERPPADTVPPAARAPSPPPAAPPPASAPRAPAPSHPYERVARPAPLPAGSAKPLLVRKVVKADPSAPAASGAAIGPTSSGRIPIAAPSASGRMPIAPPAPSSAGRVPIAPPPPSVGRVPVAAPPSTRLPAPPASAPGLPVRPPAGSVGRIPAAAPAGAARPMIRPVQRPPSPSQPDVEPTTGTKPRPPLPSHIGRGERNDDEK